MFCDGQLLPISENETLFNLIGTTYGGDGQSTFALPDLRGRLPIHRATASPWRETGGVGDGHADRRADPGAHASAAGDRRRRPPDGNPGGNVPAAARRDRHPYGTDIRRRPR